MKFSHDPRVSVVLPAFNAAQTIAPALDCIRRQTFKAWELILVDDGSTDGTRQILRDFASKELRARLICREHGGIVAALTAGLDGATSPLIARMDSDDEIHPDRLAEQVALMEANPTLGLVGSLVAFGGNRAAASGYALHVDWLNSLVTSEAIERERFVESPFAHPSVMFRRRVMEQFGGYRAGDFPEDYELWLRWLDAGIAMAKVPKVLLTWNDPADRLSRRDARYGPDAFYRCKAEYLARWLVRHVARDRPLLVWGAGRPTRKRAEFLSAHGACIAGYVDIDPLKIGRSLAGRPVLGPENLPPPARCFILGYVAKRGARDFARRHLQSRGFGEGRDFLMAA